MGLVEAIESCWAIFWSSVGQMFPLPRFSSLRKLLTLRRGWAPVTVALAVTLLAIGGIAVAGVFKGSGGGRVLAAGSHLRDAATTPAGQPVSAPPSLAKEKSPRAGVRGAAPAHTSKQRQPEQRQPGPPRTSCQSVAHIGDSTSVGMVYNQYLPSPADNLAVRYTAVGVRKPYLRASGGRSVVEELPGQVNGYGVAQNLRARGFRGCWVIALGTNDTANVAGGSTVGRLARIEQMLSVAHGEPVMWVDVKTLLAGSLWSEQNMRLWNDALRQACAKYPNLRVFDWASVANPAWFASDGIHYSSGGYAARAQLIARALTRAFPQGGHSTGCFVR